MQRDEALVFGLYVASGVFAGVWMGLVLGGGRRLIFGVALGIGVAVLAMVRMHWWTRADIGSKARTKDGVNISQNEAPASSSAEARQWLDDFLVKHQGGSNEQ